MTENSMVRQIDHIMIETSDPAKLFTLFATTLGLPEAWPLKSFGAFTSGGVFAGNVNLELIRFDTARFGGPIDAKAKVEGARLTGIAFEPIRNTSDSLVELEKREIGHGIPQAAPNWTNTQILGLLDKPGIAFICEFHFDLLDWRKSLFEKFNACQGGALGLKRISEVLVETNVPGSWQRFLGASTESFQLGSGPSIRLTPGDKSALPGIRCDVSSLVDARRALKKLELLGEDEGERIQILPIGVGGLSIELVQA
jgi:hypothetical protein